MRKNQKIAVLIMLLLIIGYIAFQVIYHHDSNAAPVISFDKQSITVDVDASDKRLLRGVHANDKEDGDLTDKVIIESISTFNSDNERTITYVVFDSEDKCVKAYRTLKYRKYEAPKITLSGSLIQSSLSMTKLNRIIGAESCVDGDISANVDLRSGEYDNHQLPLKISVSDSTGTESTLEVTYEYDSTSYTADILLKDYIVYCKRGNPESLRENIDRVMVGEMDHSASLLSYVTVHDAAVNWDKRGTYEIYYSLNSSADYTAKCKAVVVVQ